jgi:hypothetical protein
VFSRLIRLPLLNTIRTEQEEKHRANFDFFEHSGPYLAFFEVSSILSWLFRIESCNGVLQVSSRSKLGNRANMKFAATTVAVLAIIMTVGNPTTSSNFLHQ